MTDDVFGFHVPRVCRVRTVEATEDPILRTVDAFRSRDEEIIVDAKRLQAGALALPSVVAASGAVVVLGEPGAGKTSVLVDLTSELPRVGDCWDGESDACLWVSGGDLTESSYVEELRYYLDALPLAGDSATGPTGVLTVVLDQADESSFLRRLPKQLVKALQSRDNTRVRFLMACRTADYPVPMTLALVEAFGTCRCVDLAPLTREEAEALADSAGVPGKILVEEAEAARATVLASIPLTLELLVLTYKSSGRLPDTPEEIFASGVHRLVEDPDLHRLNRAVVTTAQQRLAVAGRIAAWMLLSGHRTVWRGTAFGAGAFDLPGDALAGGREWTAAGSYEATPQVVEETLATALFTVPDDNRVVFRHSSVTAYLAARYLTDRGTTQRQFESIFLVGTPDSDSASIPAPLRETAAWLVAMNPTATDWLAAADPESLAVHSALVRSDEVRRLTVSRLLERAAQIELNDTRWQLSRWDLHHPGLADQLADVLETAPNDGAPDWKTTARIRLAIELAQEADVQHPRLAVALLRLAENNAWHQTERRLAASAAFACDAAYAVPVLARMLNSLDDPSFAVLSDPDHELRGTVLTLLWPEHLDLATMLAALRPPAPHVHNAYTQFLRNMPSRCANECLPDLLDWAKTAVLDPKAPTTGFVFSSDRIENSLIESVIDRTLRSPDTMQYIEILAKIVLRLFEGHDEVRIPDCLQPDEEGQEPVETQRLRRVFAQALVEETARLGRDPRQAAWMILQDWKFRSALRWGGAFIPESAIRNQLLDGTDFTWALAQAVESATCGDKSLVAAYGELAAYLFPRDDRHAVELAYDEEHPAWPYLKSSFEPIALDSSLAHALRQGRSTHNFNPEADEHLAELARLLSEARTGDNDSLYRFIWGLRFNPKTGQREDLTGRIRTWTCAAALNDELADLPELALRYLTDEHDHADSWLVHSTDDKRSWAGYALLAELYIENRLTELPPAVWHSWPAAILTEYLGTSTSFNETERKYLLRQAAVHAPEVLARRITQLVSAALMKGRQPFELNAVDVTWTVELRTAVEGILTQLSACFGIIQRNENGGGLSAESGPEKQLSLADADDIREAAVRTWYKPPCLLAESWQCACGGSCRHHAGESHRRSDVRTVGGPGRMRAANRGCRDKLEESKSPRKHR